MMRIRWALSELLYWIGHGFYKLDCAMIAPQGARLGRLRYMAKLPARAHGCLFHGLDRLELPALYDVVD